MKGDNVARAGDAKSKRLGRPKGSANREYDVVNALPSRCMKCASTDRTEYVGSAHVLEASGIAPDRACAYRWRA